MKRTTTIVLAFLSAMACFPAAAQIYTIQANNSQPLFTSFGLLSGQTYSVKVEGTFIYNDYLSDGNTYKADAEWSWNQETKDGTWIERWPGANDPDYMMDLTINGQGIDWRGTSDPTPGPYSVFSAHTYSPSHVYQTTIVGQGAPVSFLIYDVPYYFDNTGSLTVTLSQVPEPAVGLLSFGLLGLMLRGKREPKNLT